MQRLKDLMSRDVKVVSPDVSIAEAAKQMRDGDFGMLPVGENDRMIGTISDRDITIRAVADGKDSATKVRDVMSDGVAWAYEDDSVEQAARIMSERQVRRLPGRGSRQAPGWHRRAGRFRRREFGNPTGCRGAFGNLEAILTTV